MTIPVDIAGQRFGHLYALRPTHERRSGSVVWVCRCDCGNTHRARLSALRGGQVRSCGCRQTSSIAKGGVTRMTDRTGQRFGRLVVLGLHMKRRGVVYWQCQCDCGAIGPVRAKDLVSGNTKSCGCLAARGRA